MAGMASRSRPTASAAIGSQGHAIHPTRSTPAIATTRVTTVIRAIAPRCVPRRSTLSVRPAMKRLRTSPRIEAPMSANPSASAVGQDERQHTSHSSTLRGGSRNATSSDPIVPTTTAASSTEAPVPTIATAFSAKATPNAPGRRR